MGANKGKATIYLQKMSNHMAKWIEEEEGDIREGAKRMGRSIIAEARLKVPYKNGDLSRSARLVSSSNEIMVIFGSENVPYGDYQERGETYTGKRVVRNYSKEGTGKKYLKNAGKKITEEGIKKWLLSHS